MDVVAFLAGSGAIAASAGLGAACLRLRSVWSFALAWYVLAFAEVLALCLVLSLGGMLGRPGLLVGAALLSCGSAWLWRRSGSPRPPTPALCRDARRTGPGPLVLLAGAVAFALAYVAALALGTPPSGWDQLTYHLARAAFWLQAGRVGYIGDAYDERLNYNPPGAEMAFAFVLALGRSERLPALVQLVAALACAGGVYGLARLLGLSRREAAFGALAFLATPIVLLQAATPKNDLVVASFLVAAALFLLSGAKAELVLAGIATALAVTTKVTAAYGIAVLLALAIVASPHSARKRRVATLALGTALGSGWYVINLAETGRLGGDQSQFPGMSAVGEPAANLLAASGLLLDLADAPGAEGADVAVYPLAALLVAGLLLARSVRRPAFSREREAPFVPLLVAASPFAALAASELGWPAFLSLHAALGAPPAFLANPGLQLSPFGSSDARAWYGPAGSALALAAGVAAVALLRRGALPRAAAVLAAAPALALGLLALTLAYHPWQGRFLAFPFACSAALWGLVLRRNALAWAAASALAAGALLALVYAEEKPSGLRLLEPTRTPSAWRLSRAELQTLQRLDFRPLARALDEHVPADGHMALALGRDGFGFLAFGPRLQRHVSLVPVGSSGTGVAAGWLLADRSRARAIDTACWQPVVRSAGGVLFKRRDEACRRPGRTP